MGEAAPPLLGVAAKAVVQRADGAVLLLRRSPRSTHDPGTWDLPGGKMDSGERLVDTLVREAREECGIEVTPGAPIHVSHYVVEPFWVTCVSFACTGTLGAIRLSDEHAEHAWVPLTDLGSRQYARGIAEHLDAFAALRSA